MPDFTITDRRGSRSSSASPSGRLITNNLNSHMNDLRKAGHSLPNSNVQARVETVKVMDSVNNRTLTAEMGARRSATRMAGAQRTGANVQMALPKVREPMSSFKDKGIPFDTTKPDKLAEIRRWCRIFYTTHDLIPLLIDIYAKFPVIGLEFDSKDPEIKRFYEDMFMNTLDYENFLPDLGREYWISGEVNSLAHFSDTLGVFSSEEIMNPDTLRVSKPMFGSQESEQPKERVQLLVREMVEGLRQNLGGGTDDMTHSERLERTHEYQMLVKYYPEMIDAAARDDGLDISDALISRIVNKVNPWDTRGTPHLMRSFRTLMMEESLNAAQDAVADRLYSPLILATLGIQNLGDDAGPWIPDQGEIEQTRDNLQAALAADFRLMVHHFGLDIKSVFGRESVPRFDTDYSRIDKKLMQAWGIGEALISGGTGTQNYASTALNREFVTQMMLGYQKSVKRHILKRCAVIAEAQEHFDYDTKGGNREPVYREVVEIDEDGVEYLRKVPKLLLPEIKFQSLNLRDEAQERSFLQALKNSGFPVSDHALAINVPIEFDNELDRKSEETVQKLVAEAQAMQKALAIIESEGTPIPPELAKYMAAQAQLDREEAMAEQGKANADKAKTDADVGEMSKDQFEETGVLPGAAGNAEGGDSSGPNDMDNGIGNSLSDAPDSKTQGDDGGSDATPAKPRNNSRPAESDEQRKTMPKAAGRRKFGEDPSSVKTSHRVDDARVREAIDRMANGTPTVHDLVTSSHFYAELNEHDADFATDWPDIEAYHFASDADQEKADVSIRIAHRDLSEMLEQYEMVRGVQPLWV